MKRLLRLIETGKIDTTKMTTHTFKFDEVDKAFELVVSKDDEESNHWSNLNKIILNNGCL